LSFTISSIGFAIYSIYFSSSFGSSGGSGSEGGKKRFQPEQVRKKRGAVRQWTSESKINTTIAKRNLAVNFSFSKERKVKVFLKGKSEKSDSYFCF
jgi:hypothetical protein